MSARLQPLNIDIMSTRSQTSMKAAPMSAFATLRTGFLQRKCSCGHHTSAGGECAECSKKRMKLQRYSTDHAEPSTVPPIVHEVLRSPGQPLDAATRTFMESRFGYDFSQVRVHTDAKAAASARAVNALAYTVGRDVVFGAGQYALKTHVGRSLLAHELTHVIQQSAGRVATNPSDGSISHAVDSFELAADQAANSVMVGRQAELSAPPGQGILTIQRQPLPGTPDVTLRPSPFTARLIGFDILDSFALNSFTLTEDHKRRLTKLAGTLKNLLRGYPGGSVQITGHTDATGDEKFNDKLGQQRADAVREFLVGAGVPAGAITTASAGESMLRVPTSQPEPRNRRAEVRFEPEPAVKMLPPLELKLPPLPSWPTPPTPPERPGFDPLRPGLCVIYPDLCRPETPEEAGRRIFRPVPELQTAKPEALEEIARWATRDVPIPDWLVKIVGGFGVENARKKLREALEKGGKAALEKALREIIEAVAGPPTGRLPEGPPVQEVSPPTIIWGPKIPF